MLVERQSSPINHFHSSVTTPSPSSHVHDVDFTDTQHKKVDLDPSNVLFFEQLKDHHVSGDHDLPIASDEHELLLKLGTGDPTSSSASSSLSSVTTTRLPSTELTGDYASVEDDTDSHAHRCTADRFRLTSYDESSFDVFPLSRSSPLRNPASSCNSVFSDAKNASTTTSSNIETSSSFTTTDQLQRSFNLENLLSNLQFSSSTQSTQGAIDNRIEQAMDLVKSHLMTAVRSEMEELKEKITFLEDRVCVLQNENDVLKSQLRTQTTQQSQH